MIPEPYYSIYRCLLILGGRVESAHKIEDQYVIRTIRSVRIRDPAARVTKYIEIPQEFLIPPTSSLAVGEIEWISI